jgi:hypothetical protein
MEVSSWLAARLFSCWLQHAWHSLPAAYGRAGRRAACWRRARRVAAARRTLPAFARTRVCSVAGLIILWPLLPAAAAAAARTHAARRTPRVPHAARTPHARPATYRHATPSPG